MFFWYWLVWVKVYYLTIMQIINSLCGKDMHSLLLDQWQQPIAVLFMLCIEQQYWGHTYISKLWTSNVVDRQN